MDDKLKAELTAKDEWMVNEVIFKGDEVNELYETVSDFLSIAKHTYSIQLLSVKNLEDLLKNGDAANAKELAGELTKTKEDSMAVETVISRNLAFLERLANILWIELDDEGYPKVDAGEAQDDTTDWQQGTEVPENA